MLRIIQGATSYIFVLFLYKGSCPATDNDPCDLWIKSPTYRTSQEAGTDRNPPITVDGSYDGHK